MKERSESNCLPHRKLDLKEKYIKSSMVSALNQIGYEGKLIIFNDCSNDETATEIEKIKDKRFSTKIHNEHLNLGGNLNRCISYVNAKYFLMIWGNCNSILEYRLFLSSSGQITNVAPDAPLHEVRLGKVIVSDATNGSIYIDIMNGYELDEIHNVKISGVLNEQIIAYNSGIRVWENVNADYIVRATSGNLHNEIINVSGWNKQYTDIQIVALSGYVNLTSGNLKSYTDGKSVYIGTTSIAFNRSSAAQSLTGITSIDGSAASVANALTIIS